MFFGLRFNIININEKLIRAVYLPFLIYIIYKLKSNKNTVLIKNKEGNIYYSNNY